MFHVFWVLPPGFSRNFPKSQSLKFFQVPDIYDDSHLASLFQVPELAHTRNFSKSQRLYGESSEFCQVPGPLYRVKNIWRLAPRFARCFALLLLRATYFFILTCFVFYAPLGNIRICENTPPSTPPADVTFEKMSGRLGKISRSGPRG